MNLILKLLIKKKQVITFDIFDTLIERDVEMPRDIFFEVGKKILGEENADRFCRCRIEAEENARKRSVSCEVTLDDIYLDIDEVIRDILKKEEIAQELLHCKRKKSIQLIFEYAKRCKKRIFLISDMYLPHDAIEEMLNKCGIKGYEKCYISNEYGASKRRGELFDVVLKEQDLSANEILHIGDSITADFISPLRNRIIAFPIGRKNRIKRLFYGKKNTRSKCR